jgi:hypothetical protein
MMRKKKLRVSQALGSFVRAKFTAAQDFKRRDVYDRLLRCVDMVRGRPIVDLDDEIECGLTMNIVSPIVRGIVGMLRDIYANNADQPFVLDSSPVVDLPETVREQLEAELIARYPQMIQNLGYDQSAYKADIEQLKQTTIKMENMRAVRAASALTPVVNDQLLDAGWSAEFENKFLHNYVVFPTAIMKVPVWRVKKWKRWNGTTMAVEEKVVCTVETVSPFDFYPAPGASCVEDAEYVIERRRVNNSELRSYSSVNGFDDEGLDLVLETYPDGHVEEYEDGQNTTNQELGIDSMDEGFEGFYDALGYFGVIPGSYLVQYGVDGVEAGFNYEAEVWTVGDIVIKARLNPDSVGRRPFRACSFEPIPGEFWGECPVTRLEDIQRVCTSTVAHMIRNLSFSSGPILEVVRSRFEDDTDAEDFSPYTTKDIKPDLAGNQGRAINTVETQSKVSEFMALFDKFVELGYDAVGIPKALFGSPDGLGTIGRSAGGIAAVFTQASKSIKYSMRLLEEGIIEPSIQWFVDYTIMTTRDDTLKGDIRVRARGVTGIADREAKREGLEWALQSIAPMVGIVDPTTGQPVIPATAPARILFEIFKARGIPTDGVFTTDFDLQDALQADTSGSAQNTPEVVATPTLDGRSGDMQQALTSENGL